MEEIQVTVNGKEYFGKVKIEGKRKLRFMVFYKGRKKTDAKDYSLEQRGYLMGMAEQILKEMIASKL